MLTQCKYLSDLLHRTHMADAHPVFTPMVSSGKLSKSGSSTFADPILFRSVVGALQYVTLTRPDALTKPLSATRFQFLRSKLNVQDSAPPSP